MVVGTGDAPYLAVRRCRKTVPQGHTAQIQGSNALGYLASQAVLAGRAGSVYELPESEQYEALLYPRPVERAAEVVDRMRQRVDDARLPQVVHQSVHAAPTSLRLSVDLLVQPVDEHVHGAILLGESGGDLLAHEEVRMMG